MSRPVLTFVEVPIVGAEPASPSLGSVARPARPVRRTESASTVVRMFRDDPELQALVLAHDPDADQVRIITRDLLKPDLGREVGAAFRKAHHLVTGTALVMDPGTAVLGAARRLAEHGSPLPDAVVRGESWGWAPAAGLLVDVVSTFEDFAARDAVSGVMNRDSLDLTLEAWCNAIAHTPNRLVVLVLRAEGLEKVNEIAGRAAGDVVVAAVVAQIAAAAPDGAFVGRVGGGEVVLLGVLPDTPPHRLGAGVEALRQSVTTAANTPGKLPARLSRVRWPTVRSGASVSARGSADPDRVVNDARLNLKALTAAPSAPGRRGPLVVGDLRRSGEAGRPGGEPARTHKFLTGVAAPAASAAPAATPPGGAEQARSGGFAPAVVPTQAQGPVGAVAGLHAAASPAAGGSTGMTVGP